MNSKKVNLDTRSTQSVPNLFKQALAAQQHDDLINAERLYQQILAISPNHSDSLFNLGLIALQTGRMAVASNIFQKAANLAPSAEIYNLLGLALMNDHREAEAIFYCQKALSLDATEYMAHNNLGILYCKQHRYQTGQSHLEQAIAISPNDFAALNDLALCLMQQGKYQQAADYFRRAIALDAQAALAHHNLLLCLCFDEDAFPQRYLLAAQKLDTLLKSYATPYTTWQHTTPTPQQLRVGLVSGDLSNHPVGYFLESIVKHTNPKRIELFVYNTANYDDELTKRLKINIVQWVDIGHLNDQQAAAKIHQDGIDLLIDLAGHTAHNRLSVFAWKPAPIQVSWLGYFASTGLSFIDYFLADPISIPPQNRSYFSEKIHYLPETRLCFSPPAHDIPQEISALPAAHNGFITFGCFQNLGKVNNKMLALWATILQQCPRSRLMFKNQQIQDEVVQQQLLTRLKNLGIESERIILEAGGSRAQYFAAYSRVDFMLDTFPYPGGTTTCEALWMGVPTLTLAGNTLLERQGMAMLSCVHLDDWITHNEDAYIQQAIAHANNIPKLQTLRQQLRNIVNHSPLMNAPRFAQHLESAFFAMWHQTMK